MENNFYMHIWVAKGEHRARKNTNHSILEGNHCLAMFWCYERGMRACEMGCKPVVRILVDEISQESCEGCCENS
jgi:hypothetical protein